MVFLLIIGIIFGIGYAVGKSSSTKPQVQQQPTNQLQTIYDIAGQGISASQTSKSSKSNQELLILFYAVQYVTNTPMSFEQAISYAREFVTSNSNGSASSKPLAQQEKPATSAASTASSALPQSAAYAEFVDTTTTRKPVDTTSQLLYFGAFLLVSSIGLFVGFAEVQGGLKVFLVSLVSLILFLSGDYLYRKTKSLGSVGITFISVALIAIPFIGLSFHIYVLNEQNPALTWLVTSILSFAAYVFSLERYRQTMTAYMVIGSSVSSLLSIVGVLSLPTYVFFWAIIATGLLLRLFSARRGSDKLLRESAEQFAQVLVPIALFASLISISSSNPNIGQLAVSLGLATLYAYVGSRTSKDESSAELYAQTIHPFAVATLGTAVFSYDQSLFQTGIVLQLLCIIYIIINFFFSKQKTTASYEPVQAIVATMAVLFTASSAEYTSVGFGIAILLAISLIYKTKRAEYVTLASSLWLVFSIVIGQYLLQPGLSLLEQIVLSSGAVIVLLALYLLISIRSTHSVLLRVYAAQVEVISLIGVGLLTILTLTSGKESTIALFAVVWFSLLLLVWLATKRLTAAIAGPSTSHMKWLVASYSVLYISQVGILLFVGNSTFSYDLSASLAALVASILGALLTRASWMRWASSVQWLTLPIVFAYSETLGASFTFTSISILYGGSAFFLMGSRLIALGRVQESLSKKSLLSLMGGESVAYMVGFYTAMAIISLYAVFDSYSSFWQALVLAVVTMVLVWYGSFVERQADAKALIPIAAQVVIGRLLWPSVSVFEGYTAAEARDLIPAASTVIALLVYSYFVSLSALQGKSSSSELRLSLAMFYVSPIYLLVFTQYSWSMAVGLIIAGFATLHYTWDKSLSLRELSGAVAVAGLMWLLVGFDVTNVILHAHIVAGLFALYAVVREIKGYGLKSQSYSLFATLTLAVPLSLAALSYSGLYSLLLLFEMSGLFILGLFIGRKHVYRIGLYTAVGALAYQLRSYGYAVVAIIAIVVIGFAIHSALKQDRDS